MTIADLRSGQTDPVLTPDDPAYAEAVQNWGGPASPDILVRPASAEEVAAALAWATAERMPVGVRSGGHGPWVHQPGGLLLDMGAFDGVEVAEGGIVRVGAGATWGKVADALAPYGLAISAGDARRVGVGGNALGAGIGWLLRKVGFAVDQMVAAEVVAADGRIVVASPGENPELFFGIRGGGGNFGVVTRIDFRATPLGEVVHGIATIDPDGIAATVRGIRDAMREAPRDLVVTLVKPPPMGPGTPPPAMLQLFWAGPDEQEARAAMAGVLAAPGVGEPQLRVSPYRDALEDPPAPPPGAPAPRMVSGNGVFSELPDSATEALAEGLRQHPASMISIRFLGGAFGDVDPDETAIAWRDAEALVMWVAFLPPDASDEDVARVGALWAPAGEGSEAVCGTFLDSIEPGVVPRMYPPATLERLRALKREWDPQNLFRRNHNIPPAD